MRERLSNVRTHTIVVIDDHQRDNNNAIRSFLNDVPLPHIKILFNFICVNLSCFFKYLSTCLLIK